MLYTCDGLLPQAQRYASGKYRRVSRRVTPARMDYGDALELAAFMGVVGHEIATYVFRWNKRTARDMLILQDWDEAKDYVEANLASVDEDDALGLVKCLREHGWRKRANKYPSFVADALRAGWKRGESAAEQSRKWGLSRDVIQRMRTPRVSAADRRRAAEFASIGLIFS